MKLYLIRHGETLWNRARIFQGKQDSPLTDIGIAQAIALGEYLREEKIKIDKVFSSPLGRAYNTAKLVFSDKEIISDRNIAEMAFGNWEGKDIEHLKVFEKDNYYNFFHKAHLYDSKPHKGESFEEVERRVEEFLNYLIENHRNETLVVVSHGLLLKVLLKHIKKDSLENFWNTEVFNNTSLSLISYDDKWKIEFISETKHLSDELQTSWVPR